MTPTVTVVSYLAAAGGFLALTILMLLSGSRRLPGVLLIAACTTTVLWAALSAYATDPDFGVVAAPYLAAVEVLRTLCWLAFAASVTRPVVGAPLLRERRHLVGAVVGGLALLALLLNVADAASWRLELPALVSRLVLAVAGLMLVENMVRNASQDEIWSLKYVALGLGAIFVYDMFVYADALLLSRISPELLQARGAINALTVPLLAVAVSRNREWAIDIHVSRRAVFHTASVLGSGIYLVGMAAVGFYLRNVGGQWGPTLQIGFFAAAIILMLLALFSGTSRAWLRFAISRHFFSYRYDYREEWHKFIAAMSASDEPLHDRAIRAVASIVESPAGALWVRWDNERTYFPAARWNLPENLPYVGLDSPLIGFFERRHWIINLDEWRDDPEAYEGMALPGWIEQLGRAWLIVPLVHRQRLEGFLVLGRPRAAHELDWEAYDLLKTLGRQVAGYLAEEAALRALVDAQQLQDFNRRFAFVVHDIKNVTGQLNLILSNAEKYWDNPDFQKDAMSTVRNSVEKMGRLLGQLRQEPDAAAAGGGKVQPVVLAPLLRRVATPWLAARPVLRLELHPHEGLQALADEEGLTAVVGHLIQNAVEAVGADGAVTVRLDRGEHGAVIDVVDNGPGMDAEFIRDQLFRPLRTTKCSGYGIGAYQTRELLRGMGGRLEVISRPGAGTTMRVVLPLPDDAMAAGQPRRIA